MPNQWRSGSQPQSGLVVQDAGGAAGVRSRTRPLGQLRGSHRAQPCHAKALERRRRAEVADPNLYVGDHLICGEALLVGLASRSLASLGHSLPRPARSRARPRQGRDRAGAHAGRWLPTAAGRRAQPGRQGDDLSHGRGSVQDQAGTPVPEDWVRLLAARSHVCSRQTKKVATRLSLPTGADPGDYRGCSRRRSSRKAAAPRSGQPPQRGFSFEVEPATLLGAWWNKLSTWFENNAPWSWLVPAVLASLLVASAVPSSLRVQVGAASMRWLALACAAIAALATGGAARADDTPRDRRVE